MKSPAFYLLFSIYLLSISACSGQPHLSGTIELEEDSSWGSMIYLIDPGSWKGVGSSYVGTVVDSASIGPDGGFAFEELPIAEEPMLLQLAIQRVGERFPNRLDNEQPTTSNYFPLVWQDGEQVVITAEADRFQATFAIRNPTPRNAAMLELCNIRQAAFAEYLEAGSEESHEELLAEEDALLAFQSELMQFAEDSPHLLPALTAIRWVSIAGNYERIPEFLVKQAERWTAEEPEHPWVQQLAAVGDRRKLPVLVGDLLPDYPMPMLAGDTVSLHSLLGERLTLVDLWASWCGPCRVQNRNFLVPLWDKYHESGFQVVGYGLEASSKAWTRAIETDGAYRWPHASDLQGDDSPLFELLRLTTIPANFLLDAEGRVVAKNLHGEELMEYVRRVME
ncbi:TlpA family protein disulfide reductase [Lewinella cohaerens]|uniref:TlpA family protein disulfide reductase n=1 Tax=Lewinella cohaerens TaxID=70995 RepID=UPI00036162BC|nr:TlpA disulfide reductase family protein [Lewinella cohaerens]